jgi:hypothetical protein
MSKITTQEIDELTYLKYRSEKRRWYGYFLGIYQRHTYWMYKVIDDILNENKQIKGIIEIGTIQGALSIFLGLECYERGLKPLLTYDIKEFKEPKLFELLKIRFIDRDCFHETSVNEIKEYADVPIFFMCDGDHKIEEFNYFAGLLKPDSIIAAHDWGIEIGLKNILDTINEYEMEALHKEEWDSPPDYIKTSFWRKGKRSK